MNIKAKLRCDNVEKVGNGEQIELNAVYSEDKSTENYSFSAATPSARLSMFISNPSAIGAFEVGKEYYLDFTPAP